MQRLLFLLALAPLYLFSQNSYSHLAGARSAGLAHATVALPHSFSTHHNQASLAFLTQKTVAASYQQRYLLPDLNLGHLGFSSPIANGHMGVAFTQFGFADFNETKIGLAYAQRLSKYLALGVQLNYEQSFVAQAETFRALSFEAGLMAQINQKLNLAFHIYNPNGGYLNRSQDLRLPTIARLGAAYTFSPKALWVAQVLLQSGFRPKISTGYEYTFVKAFSLRVGMAAADDYETSFGLGYQLKDLNFNLAYQYGFILGPNLNYGLAWAF